MLRHREIILIIFTFTAPTFAAQVNSYCYSHLIQSAQANTAIPASMQKAILAALGAFAKTGQRVPKDFDLSGTVDGSIARQTRFWRSSRSTQARVEWLKSFADPSVLNIPSPEHLEVIHSVVSVVYRLTFQGRIYYFKPAMETHPLLETTGDIVTVSRFTYLASAMNIAMHLHTCARVTRAIVNGMPGVLSEEVPGVRPSRWNPNELDNASDVIGFEFLFGTYDLHDESLRIDGRKARTFDYSEALINGLPLPMAGFYFINTALPSSYSPQFLSNTRQMDRRLVEQNFGSLMTPEEIDGFLFRREIILQDAALRADSIRRGE